MTGVSTAAVAGVSEIDPWHSVGSDPTFGTSFLNSWVNGGAGYQVVQFCRDPFGRVHIRGYASSGTNGTSIFTLPVGYRPASRIIVICLSGTAGSNYLDISTAGDVLGLRTGTDLHINSIIDTRA